MGLYAVFYEELRTGKTNYSMKKVYVDRTEPLDDVLNRILAAEEDELALVIPRNSKLGSSIANFHALEREAGKAGKRLVVESVDEEVLAFAEASNLESVHPLFSGGHMRSLSDIVPREKVAAESPEISRKPAKKSAKKEKKVTLKVVPEIEADEKVEKDFQRPPAEKDEDIPDAAEKEYAEDAEPAESPPRSRAKIWITAAVILVLAGAAVWAMSTIFARAKVALTFNTIPWEGAVQVTADKAIADIDLAQSAIPGEVFRDSKNLTQLFPASGKSEVAQKATGRITIYNAFNSSPQTLVATTRFETPDGKIFRLDKQVIVPGAAVKDGKIIPASTEADVTADKAGEEYNVAPVARLTVPGFKGTPRYEGFSGELKSGTKNGFVGEKAVPTESDIAAAKQKTEEILRASLSSNVLNKRAQDFIIPEGASAMEITRLTVNQSTDANGNFSVFGEGSLTAIGFREEDLKSLLLQIASAERPNSEFHDLALTYQDISPRFADGRLQFKAEAKGSLTAKFSADEFGRRLAGQSSESARAAVLDLAGLADGKISLWPFWLRNMPTEAKKIKLNVSFK